MIFRPRVYNQVAAPSGVKLAAVSSLVLWLSIVCAGRGVGYMLAIIRKRIFLNMRPGGQGEPLKFEAKVVEVAVG